MERKQFLRSLFAVAVAAAIKDTSILKLADPISESLPGIGGQVFTIRLHPGWFGHGDVIRMNNDPSRHWLFINKKGKAALKLITDNPNEKMEMAVEFFEDLKTKLEMEELAVRICSSYEEA